MKTQIVRRRPLAPKLDIRGLHPVLERIYAHRGVGNASEIEHTTVNLLPYHLLSGLNNAIPLLASCLQIQERILIVGDYDADGATSTAVALQALRTMGAKQVDFLVPNRLKDGYGLTPEIVNVAAQKKPDLIITVDNGISSIAGVAAAHECGIRVCITDHHLPGETLPEADAIVNPNLSQDGFPSKHLAGVGVIFYVMLALRAHLREQKWFREKNLPEPNLAKLLDIVALGTVADVVPLDANNRILVHQGLQRIRGGAACPGIMALLEAAGRSAARVTAADLGFFVAPRLNAAGRLEDMSLGIACLLANNLAEAKPLALELNRLNSERRGIENEMRDDALQLLTSLNQLYAGAEAPLGIALFQENWHPGVIGILAGRIKEQWHRPVIAFAPGLGDELKGSARSIPGIHIRDVLQEIATQNPTLIEKFGGHAMAAGLTIKRAHWEDFSKKFDKAVRRVFPKEALQRQTLSDGELAPHEFTLDVAKLIQEAGPWGQGFPEPLFDGFFKIINQRVVGGKHLKLTVSPVNNTQYFDAIFFNSDALTEHDPSRTIQIAYRLDVNKYNGTERLQLLVDEIV